MTNPKIGFDFFAVEVTVQRRGFGGRRSEWTERIRFRDDIANVWSGSELAAGDVVVRTPITGPKRRIVAAVQWNPKSKIGVVTWADLPDDGRLEDPMRDEVNLEFNGGRLLDWVYANRADNPAPIDIAEFAGSDPEVRRALGVLAQHLASHGWLSVIRSPAGPVTVSINSDGAHLAKMRADLRADTGLRTAELRKALLLWLHDEESAGRTVTTWLGFFTSPRSHFVGDLYSDRETGREIDYITEKGFVTGSTYPRLTADGRDCVTDFGGEVADYSKARQSTGGITVHSSPGTVIQANSPGAVQNVGSTVDTAKVTEFANLVRQLAPVLGLAEQQREQLEMSANELTTTTEPGRLKRIWARIYSMVHAAEQTEAGKMLLNKGVEALGHVGEEALKQLM